MKKLMAFLLSAVLCLSLLAVPEVNASAAGTQTLSVSNVTQAAATLNMMGAIQGDGSGALGLSDTMTRAQFCKIAVVVMGLSGKVNQYSGYTIFPDVPSTSWAAGYVNLAVRYAGILSGYSSGNFGPNDNITYAQAVTILMKMLGYGTADVGAQWPDGFLNKADEIGLTAGVSLSASDKLTKGDMAVLFLNLLNSETNGTDKTFMETVQGVSVVNDVFLVSADAEASDGSTGAVEIAGANSGTYIPVNSVPDSLLGAYGALLVSSSGKALTFVPSESGKTTTSTVSEAAAGYIKCADGTKIAVSSTAAFYFNGDKATYGSVWADIDSGMLVSAHYTDGGTLQSILVATADIGGTSTVVNTDSYALPSSAGVTLNGKAISSSDIKRYDVLTQSASGLYTVTRRQITARLEDADPSTDAPDTVTVLGTDFKVLSSAAAELSSFKIGDIVTLLLTSGNKVAGAVSGTTLYQINYGVVSSLTTASVAVKLTNGVTVSGSRGTVSTDVAVGSFVKVNSSSEGSLDVYSVASTTSYSTLDVENRKIGNDALSKSVKIYERVGSSAVGEIGLEDILVSTVVGSKIQFVAYDASGDVNLLVLDDVTGDQYTYGIINGGETKQTAGSYSSIIPTVSVTNSDGTTSAVVGYTRVAAGDFAGIAASPTGTLAGWASLTTVSGISRSAFEENEDGSFSVTMAGGVIPVSENVQVYNAATGKWTTLSKARSYSDNLTIYYDKTIETGAKVRIVVAN